MIDDKYCKEYKLDRDTRAMAIEILFCYYNKNQAETNVSSLSLSLSLSIMLVESCGRVNEMNNFLLLMRWVL